MLGYLNSFKKVLVVLITVMMAVVLVSAVAELGYILFQDLASPPYFILDIKELLEVFGIFMLVLIGIELLETLEIYIRDNVVHVEIVFTVALIAIARKVIILDVKTLSGGTLFSIGFIILALSVGYYLIKKTFSPGKKEAVTGAVKAPKE